MSELDYLFQACPFTTDDLRHEVRMIIPADQNLPCVNVSSLLSELRLRVDESKKHYVLLVSFRGGVH